MRRLEALVPHKSRPMVAPATARPAPDAAEPRASPTHHRIGRMPIGQRLEQQSAPTARRYGLVTVDEIRNLEIMSGK